MFVQIHTLTGYSSALLNRDDTGMAKRVPYGDSIRTRISSQFVKRRLRLAEGKHSVASLGEISVRSRLTFRQRVAERLVAEGHDAGKVVPVVMSVMDAVYKPSESSKKTRKENEAKVAKGTMDAMALLERDEINVLSAVEISYLLDVCRASLAAPEPVKDILERVGNRVFKDNLLTLGQSGSLDVAMFGRMVTGDALATVDAALHVGHGITVHAQATEMDYFTAVDDLNPNGAGHVGEAEITSPLLYGNYVLDVRQLYRNIEGIDNRGEVAPVLAANIVHLVAKNVVGAKLGSTAPYSRASLVMAEFGTIQPRTLAEAFRPRVGATLEAAVNALSVYLDDEARMYGEFDGQRMSACMIEMPASFGEKMTLDGLAQAVGQAVRDAEV